MNMNAEKKLLSKKRKKIFSIKNFSKKNNSNNILSKLKKKNNKSKEIQPQSLINISKLVLDYIKQNNKTTGNEITEYVKNVLQANDSDETTQKNIQRRVYDSINIMSPGNIIKNKQTLEFIQNKNNENIINKKEEKNEIEKNINHNNNINNKNNNSNSDNEDDEDRELNEEEMEEYKNKLKLLKDMQKNLIKQYITLKFYEKYSNNSNNNSEINLKENKCIIPIENNNYENRNSIINNGKDLCKLEFENLYSYEIMKKIIAPDILSKLNNENNINGNFKNIYLIKNNNDNKNEKEKNDEVFNYLKNVDLFREEITNSVKKSNQKKVIKKIKKKHK